jgi:hypothetical protein
MKKYVKMTLFLLLIIVSCYFHYLQIQNLGKADTRKLVEEIRPLVGKNDFVYVTDPLDFHTVEYYLNEDQVRIYGKPYSEIRSYVGKVLIPPDKIATTLPIYPQKAIIITGPTSYSIQSIY